MVFFLISTFLVILLLVGVSIYEGGPLLLLLPLFLMVLFVISCVLVFEVPEIKSKGRKIVSFSRIRDLFHKEVDPCGICIVEPCCSEHCEKYPKHIALINKRAEKIFYDTHKMPCCGSTGFYEGPHGGANQNITCANCGERWNICLPIRLIEKI